MSGHRTPAAGRTSLLRRLVPHPLLMLAIALGWLMLVNDFSLGSLLFGLLLGLVVAKITAAFWPPRARVRRPLKIVEYARGVLWDIVFANVTAAAHGVFRRNRGQLG